MAKSTNTQATQTQEALQKARPELSTPNIGLILDVVNGFETYPEETMLAGLPFQIQVDTRIPFLKTLAHAALNTAISSNMRLVRMTLEIQEKEGLVQQPTLDSRAEIENAESPTTMETHSNPNYVHPLDRVRREAMAAAQYYNTIAADLVSAGDAYNLPMTIKEMLDFRTSGEAQSDETVVRRFMETMKVDRDTAVKASQLSNLQTMSLLMEHRQSIHAAIEGAGVLTKDTDTPEVSIATQIRWIHKMVTKTLEAADRRILNSLDKGAAALHRAEYAKTITQANATQLLKAGIQLITENREELISAMELGLELPDMSQEGVENAVKQALIARIENMHSGATQKLAG